MNQMLDNITKFEKLNNIINIIQKYNDNENYKEAYYKAAGMLEFINANLIMKIFNIKLDDTDIIKYIEIYNKKDKVLSKKMISVNGEYNMIDTDEITKHDVGFLLLKIDDILEYIIGKYGTDFLE